MREDLVFLATQETWKFVLYKGERALAEGLLWRQRMHRERRGARCRRSEGAKEQASGLNRGLTIVANPLQVQPKDETKLDARLFGPIAFGKRQLGRIVCTKGDCNGTF